MKTGDKVKIIKVGLFVDNTTIGKIGVITSVLSSVSNDSKIYKVEFKDDFWYYNEDDLQISLQREEKLKRILK